MCVPQVAGSHREVSNESDLVRMAVEHRLTRQNWPAVQSYSGPTNLRTCSIGAKPFGNPGLRQVWLLAVSGNHSERQMPRAVS
jgi:hypothetical protein